MPSMDELLQQQVEIIDRVGWSVVHVFPAPDDPPTDVAFTYTVGLTAHDHPELVLAGLPPQIAQALLNDLGRRVFDQAARFSHGERLTDVLVGYDAIIVDGTPNDALHPGIAWPRQAPPAATGLARPARPVPVGERLRVSASRPALDREPGHLATRRGDETVKPCPVCGTARTVTVQPILVGKPPGTYSIAGVQPKAVAEEKIALACSACGLRVPGRVAGAADFVRENGALARIV
jgi:hypothetical protein